MAQPIVAPMPARLDLSPTYTLRVTALDPSTGSPVANVKIGQVVITAEGETSGLQAVADIPLLLGVST